MIKGSVLFLAGTLASASLFHFDLGLPSFHTKQHLAQKAKIDHAKKSVKKRRANLSKNSFKKAGKKAAGSLIPIVGTAVTLGLAAEDYCDELETLIELQNILDDKQEEFDTEVCLKEAELFIQSQIE